MKLGRRDLGKAASNLIRMRNKMVRTGAEKPSFLMILNATGGAASTRSDGVIEIPIGCPGP